MKKNLFFSGQSTKAFTPPPLDLEVKRTATNLNKNLFSLKNVNTVPSPISRQISKIFFKKIKISTEVF